MHFGGRKADPHTPPENSKPVSVNTYSDFLEQRRDHCSNEIGTLEGLLEALDKALGNEALRVTCYITTSGAGMDTEEKEPVGFIHLMNKRKQMAAGE